MAHFFPTSSKVPSYTALSAAESPEGLAEANKDWREKGALWRRASIVKGALSTIGLKRHDAGIRPT